MTDHIFSYRGISIQHEPDHLHRVLGRRASLDVGGLGDPRGIENLLMTAKPVSLGPWKGIDNVHRPSDRTFQIPGEREQRLAALVAATDVDLTDDSWPVSRLPTVADTALTVPLGGWAIAGRMFYQAADRLYERTTTDTALITGLVQRVLICEHWGKIFVTDGTNHWEIDGTTVRNWGLPIPTLSSFTSAGINGNLYAPGTYLVQAAFVDSRGNEGGVSVPQLVTIAETWDGVESTPLQVAGIEFSVSGYTPEVASVNLYISEANQQTTSYYGNVLPADGNPVRITSNTTVGDPPVTGQMRGPIDGAGGIFSFRAFLLMWRGNVVFRSEGAEPHLFHGNDIMQFPAPVTAAEGVAGGVAGGMWIGTEQGLWWVQGEDPDKWIPLRKTPSGVLRGSAKVQGNKLPKVQTNDMVALFATYSGLVAGMPDGTALHLTDGVYTFPTHARASFAYAERDDLRQILIGLVED